MVVLGERAHAPIFVKRGEDRHNSRGTWDQATEGRWGWGTREIYEKILITEQRERKKLSNIVKKNNGKKFSFLGNNNPTYHSDQTHTHSEWATPKVKKHLHIIHIHDEEKKSEKTFTKHGIIYDSMD